MTTPEASPFQGATCVLHVFQKKSGQASKRDIELARRRYKIYGGVIL